MHTMHVDETWLPRPTKLARIAAFDRVPNLFYYSGVSVVEFICFRCRVYIKSYILFILSFNCLRCY